MSADGTARDNVLEAIRGGKLPGRSPHRTWAGPGSGAPCMTCGQRINPDELEYELEFAPGDDNQQPVHHVHISCFQAWETERQKLELNGSTGKAVQLSSEVAETRLVQDEWEVSGSGGPA